MAKTIWKYRVPILAAKTEFNLTGPLLPHIEFDQPDGVNFWAEAGVWAKPNHVILHAMPTGASIPDSWKWLATSSGNSNGLVFHLYEEPQANHEVPTADVHETTTLSGETF